MSLFDLIPSAYAQAATQAPPTTGDMLQSFAPFVIIIGIFYFLMFRPQQQKAKALRTQLSQLRRGDSVVTSGGIIGTVARVVGDNELSVEIAEGVRVRVVRSTVTGVMSKSEAPAANKNAVADDDSDDEPSKPKTSRRGKTAAAPPSDGGSTG